VPVTPAQFRTAFPAFRNVEDAVVQPALEEAYSATGDSWGDRRDRGAMWYAADIIASDPRAEPSAKSVKGSNGTTVYRRQWERLLQQVRMFGTAVSGVAPAPGGE